MAKPTDKPPRKRGGDRPSTFTPAIAARICDALVEGRTLASICREDWAPTRVTVFNWRRSQADFDRDYLAARAAQMETLSDDVLDIAENAEAADIPKARLRIEARRVVLARLAAIYVVNEEQGADFGTALQKARERAVGIFDRIKRANERISVDAAIEERKSTDGGVH